MRQSPCRGWFVTDADTGVGKSVVAAALAGALRRRGLDVGVMKPVQSGAVPTAAGLLALDGEFLRQVAGVDDPPELICPIRLQASLAPAAAAELEGREIDVQEIMAAFEALTRCHEGIIVEGAGGICVPVSASYLMADLARDLQLPLLVVARPLLGTINHTLLTVRYARALGLEIAGIIVNNFPAPPGLVEQSSLRWIEQLAGAPVLGTVPHDPEVDVDRGRPGRIVESMEGSPLLDRLVPHR